MDIDIGIILVVIGAIICFGADRFYKKGKIKDFKGLLMVKLSGLAVTIVGLIIAIYVYN